MRALLLIDIQNDFLPGGALAVPEGNAILPVVNKLQEQFDLVVATQDWHPPQHKSFASSHAGKNVFEVIDLNGMPQVLWPDHCIQGTAGAELSAELAQNRIEAIFRKGTNPEIDSYSGFYDNGHLKSTGLADYLRGKGVTEVYLVGLAADYCVYFSALDALQELFEVYYLEDAVRAINGDGFEKAKADLLAKGGHIIQSHNLHA
ncbi:bifunctional nicotinamidase/pyrazinamidase [Pontibacter akesuensis]|uniref:Nicotinamidase n=1 Tax=Pontibacter akesuensis TaxID=388950 RepID=A0A1I7KLZ9_9BACT|nr:bifunctional nicotinamidase/pyrazinamidase [Pontibacter akesuensis]GHA77719.1 bifunctional pyrazinamidase/nicotinamidase [Pontibacter akesuensis]SFU98450.1 nicotinamidase/pyrazinamidase [Pontibacter akesuensis]